MRPNHVLRAIREDRQTIGGWLCIDSAYTAEVMSHIGFDWLCLDMQHGMLGYDDIKSMLPAISTSPTIPLVRVPWNEPSTIMKALDAGAYGVIVPLVNNREEAERAVAACRYPPVGIRSLGPTRGMLYGGPDYVQHANNEIACIVMIETAEALNNLNEIMSTPGVDAIYIGTGDLAFALGLNPAADSNDALHVEAVDRIFECAREHGIGTGIHTASMDFSKRYLEQGFNMVTLGVDSAFMSKTAYKQLATVRKDTGMKKVERMDSFY